MRFAEKWKIRGSSTWEMAHRGQTQEESCRGAGSGSGPARTVGGRMRAWGVC